MKIDIMHLPLFQIPFSSSCSLQWAETNNFYAIGSFAAQVQTRWGNLKKIRYIRVLVFSLLLCYAIRKLLNLVIGTGEKIFSKLTYSLVVRFRTCTFIINIDNIFVFHSTSFFIRHHSRFVACFLFVNAANFFQYFF